MALVIEDGTIVDSANSFVTEAEAIAWAAARGVTIAPGEGDKLAALAMDFIVSVEDKLAGVRTDPENQELPYPRTGVLLYSAELLSNGIPKTLKQAQMQLMLDAHNGVPLLADDLAEAAIQKEKAGPLETTYFPGGVAVEGASLEAAYGYLRPLFKTGFGLRTLRI